MKFLNDYKTYIGMISLGLLYMLGDMFPAFAAMAMFPFIASGLKAWTGVAIAHKGNKILAALKGK